MTRKAPLFNSFSSCAGLHVLNEKNLVNLQLAKLTIP